MAEKKTTIAATTEAAATEAPQAAPAAENPQAFLDNFNWHNYEEGIEVIEEKQLQEFEKLVAENFVDTADEDVIEGVVAHLDRKSTRLNSSHPSRYRMPSSA